MTPDPRSGVGVVERYDPAQCFGIIIAETGERRLFRLSGNCRWSPRSGESVVFTRVWDRRGLVAAAVTPFRPREPAPAPTGA